MKRIVFFTTPAYGHILSVIPVIHKLVKKGYIVECHSTNKFKEIIEKSGAQYIEYEIEFEKYMLNEITSNMFELTKALSNINRQAYEKYESYIESNRPDLIIYDSMCSFAKNISKKNKMKSICFVTTLGFNLSVILTSNLGRTSIAIFLKNIAEVLKILKREKQFRKKNKLPKINLVDLFINEADETIVFTPKEFQPLAWTFPKNFHFVGTTIKDREQIFKGSNEHYEHYDYYISFGSIFSENRELLQKTIDYNNAENNKIIVSAGNTTGLENINENIHVEEKVNQIRLLPHCDFFVNHAGINSVYESIYFEIPQVCIPMQEEQKYVAKIVHKKKLGIYMKKYNIEDFEKLKKLKDSFKIKKMSEILKKYDGTNLAVDIIENLLERNNK